jgi:hypothetical protein
MSKQLFPVNVLTARILSRSYRCVSKLLLTLVVLLKLVSLSEAAGPLTTSNTNGRYFVDSNGTPVYLAGVHIDEYNLLNGGSSNFAVHLDILQQYNHNFTRVWAWEQSPWFFGENGHMSFTSQPYERTGPGLASDGDLKFDLTRFNQAYFDQLRSRVMEAGERGIYVSVMLFEGFSSQKRIRKVNPWLGDPFELNNNINGLNGDPNRNGGGEEFFSLAFPSMLALQEAFARKVVDTLNDLDNVLYEVSGNGLAAGFAWQVHIVDYIKNYQRTKPNQHPVGLSQFDVRSLQNALNSSADWIVVAHTTNAVGAADARKVTVLEANPGLLKPATAAQWVWKRFTQGYNVILPFTASTANVVNDSVYAAVGQSVGYAQIIDLASMPPDSSLCSTQFCLANPGVEYLTYLPAGGAVTLRLNGGSESFLPAWFAPATGETLLGAAVPGGKSVKLTSPISGESLLHLVRQSLSPRTPTNNSQRVESETAFAATAALDVNAASSSAAVATPIATPNGGIYTGKISVSLKTSTPKATIYYTTDGQSPTQSSRKYKAPFTLSTSTMVKAKAFKNGLQPSAEASVWFSNAGAPISFNFTTGNSGDVTVTGGESVTNTITTALSGGNSQAVSFSVSGLPSGSTPTFSRPSCNPTCSTVLTIQTATSAPSGSFPVTVTASGGGISKTTTFALTVASPPSTVATPTFTPNGGSFSGSVPVSIQTSTPGAAIYYTTNGSTPTQSSALYAAPISVASTTVIKAKAFKSGSAASAEASASFTVTQSAPLGLVAHWKFDEGSGSTAADSSGNGNTGTLVNGPLWTTGMAGSALYLDGIDDSVTVADSTSLNLTGSFTLSAWVNPADIFTDFRSILVKNGSYYLYGSVAGNCGAGNPLGGFIGQPDEVCEAAPLPVDSWTQLTLTSNGSTLTLYRNGIAATSANTSSAVYPSAGALQIAASEFGEYFKGLIDEVRIYNKALTAAEVQALYQEQAAQTPQTVAAPVITPNGGSFTSSASVTIQTATSGAAIYYTTNGSTPTQSSTLYAGPISIASTTVIKTKAFKNGYNASAEASASFTITPAPTVATPTINPNGGSFTSSASVTIQTATAGASIYYTANGSTPTQSSTLYTGPISIASTTVIKAKAFKSGYSASAEASASFTLNIPPPAPTCPQPGSNSFTGCYYSGMDFDNLVYTRNDPQINFNWLLGSPDSAVPAERFSVRWEGTFNFAQAATYRFTATADDGIRVYVDGALKIDRWIEQSATTYTADVALTQGNHLIKVEYYENGGDAEARVSWAPVAVNPPASAYSTLKLTWTDASNNEDGFKVERLVNGIVNKTITLAANVNSYTDSSLTAGSVYCYRVRAFNAVGTSGSSNEVCSVPLQ